jgi:hypothetical protein
MLVGAFTGQDQLIPKLPLVYQNDNDIAGGDIPVNTWGHAVGTYDGLNRKLYVDAKLVAQDSFTNGILNANDSLGIGRYLAWGIAYSKGEIDEVRIYNRALSES